MVYLCFSDDAGNPVVTDEKPPTPTKVPIFPRAASVLSGWLPCEKIAVESGGKRRTLFLIMNLRPSRYHLERSPGQAMDLESVNLARGSNNQNRSLSFCRRPPLRRFLPSCGGGGGRRVTRFQPTALPLTCSAHFRTSIEETQVENLAYSKHRP